MTGFCHHRQQQENPDRSQDFQEPKTKIYETITPYSSFWHRELFLLRTAAKIHFFSIVQVSFEK